MGICISFNCPDEKTVIENFERIKDKTKILNEPEEKKFKNGEPYGVFAAAVIDPTGYKVEYQFIRDYPCFH